MCGEAAIEIQTQARKLVPPAKLLWIAFAVGGLALAISWTVRIGLADLYFHRSTLQGTETAIRLTPGQAEYQDDLASFFREEDESRAIRAYQRAVNLDRYDANAWIHLGLIYERENRLDRADRAFHHAARVDRTFMPAWSLANFYFRQDNAAQFWLWIRQASRLVPEDASPLFRLCWHFTDDGNQIAQQLDLTRPDMMAQYLNFLKAENRKAAVGTIALRLAASRRTKDTPLLLDTLEWFMRQHQEDEALALWNVLAAQGRIPFHGLNPRFHPALVNGSFTQSPTSVGFDWHLPNTVGISVSQESGAGGLRVEFSGDQPESAEVLAQVLAVKPNRSYTFAFDYSTSGIAPNSGLTWKVVDLPRGSTIASTDGLSSDKRTAGHMNFATPADCRFVQLALGYQRALGTTRIEGSLVLHTTGLTTDRASPSAP